MISHGIVETPHEDTTEGEAFDGQMPLKKLGAIRLEIGCGLIHGCERKTTVEEEVERREGK